MKTCPTCGSVVQDLNELEKLTPREREVLALMREGFGNVEIAKRLIVEYGTVKNHVHSILAKLAAKTRTEAVRKVYGESIFSDSIFSGETL